MTPERIAEIEALHAAATEGPWWFDEDENCWRLHGVLGRIPADPPFPEQVMNKQILKAPKKGTPYAEYWPDGPDAAFIAAAWTIVGELLAERAQLRADAHRTWSYRSVNPAGGEVVGITMKEADARKHVADLRERNGHLGNRYEVVYSDATDWIVADAAAATDDAASVDDLPGMWDESDLIGGETDAAEMGAGS